MSKPQKKGEYEGQTPQVHADKAKGGLEARNNLAHVNNWEDVQPSRKLTTHTVYGGGD